MPTRVKRADPELVRQSTGQVIGGVAPVGHPQPLRTLVDTWLEPYDVVWAAAGHVHTVFSTSFGELVRITGGTPPRWARAPDGFVTGTVGSGHARADRRGCAERLL